jgi:hypothetical protein
MLNIIVLQKYFPLFPLKPIYGNISITVMYVIIILKVDSNCKVNYQKKLQKHIFNSIIF